MESFSGFSERVESLLAQLTLIEKIGQLVQVNGEGGHVSDDLRRAITEGRLGSVLNEVDRDTVDELQRIARDESPHRIPLLVGRDVIHGFSTIFPIPLGQAATFNPDLVRMAASLAAHEASASGVNWTFAPMLDVSRDPRWGRIAESFGEDPLLTAELGCAVVKGFQDNPNARVLSCAKHFVGYGASESGRDYNTTNIPEIELRNVYLPPFRAVLRAGGLSIMPSFSDVNGMPPSGSAWLLRRILREEWQFRGLVVSDWESVTQLAVHGVASDDRDSARTSVRAGVNIDMASGAYATYLGELIESGDLQESELDDLVREVLTVKFAMGLFAENPIQTPLPDPAEALAAARTMATQSVVLLRNKNNTLPIAFDSLVAVAVIGPLADEPYEQLGTWIFDADVSRSVTVRQAIETACAGSCAVHFEKGLATSRDRSQEHFSAALAAATKSDVVILVIGEESILSGEAHCRADIGLPGAQVELVKSLGALGKPIIAVVMAGRPLVLAPIVEEVDAILYAWHPGSMAGPAIYDLLSGTVSPSGKLPVTMPRALGQVPIYYGHRNTGKPPTPETVIGIDEIDAAAPQLSVGNTSFHLDVHPSPQFPFGFGLSYTRFEYSEPSVSTAIVSTDGEFVASVHLHNTGDYAGDEVVQLYARDHVASATRPVRELKAFRRVSLAPGESALVSFELSAADFSFWNGRETVIEPGHFTLWFGGSSDADAAIDFEVADR